MGKDSWKRTLSRLLNVLIVFLVAVCLILFFKIITNSDVSIGGVRFYYVATESMYPTIKPHAMMVVKETDPEKLEVGDIISFVSRDPAIYGQVNTHRIYAITEEDGELAFVTKGDNNPSPDTLHVYPDEIKGKVIAHTPPIKGLTSLLSFAGTKMGFFIVILMPLMLVTGMFFSSFMREFRESLQREADELEALKQQKLAEMEDMDGIDGINGKIPGGDGSGAEQPGERAADVVGSDETMPEVTAEDSVTEEIITFSAESVPKAMAVAILEKYFGKPIEEITENDINQKLKEL